MPIVQFAPFQSLVQPAFWHALTNLKIDVLRLSDDAVPVHATYATGRAVKDRETGKEIALGCNLSVGDDAFAATPQYAPHLLLMNGRSRPCAVQHPPERCPCPRLVQELQYYRRLQERGQDRAL